MRLFFCFFDFLPDKMFTSHITKELYSLDTVFSADAHDV